MNETDVERRRRWVTFGELIALAALIVSAIGVWINWKADNHKPQQSAEPQHRIALMLHAKIENDGQKLEITPVEPSHALESLTVNLKGASPIEIGSDGELSASDIQSALKGHDKEPKGKRFDIPAQIDTHYVERGTEREARGAYVIRYEWEGGGLFGGRALKLVGLSHV